VSKQNTSRQYDFFFGLVDQVTLYFLPGVNTFDDFISCLTSDKLLRETNCVLVENENLLQNEKQNESEEGKKNENLISWLKVEHSGYGCMCGQHFSPKLDLTGNEIKAVMELTNEPGLKFDKQLKKIRLISFNDLQITKTKEITQELRGFHIQTNKIYRVEPTSVCVLELEEKIKEPLKVFEKLFQKWKDQSNFG
jgi:hypothetical protein